MNIRDLTLGFDFGTSTTKIVIRDEDTQRNWAVVFPNGTTLLPTLLYYHITGDYFSLQNNDDHIPSQLTSVKVDLMDDNPDSLVNATAYIGNALTLAKSWFLEQNTETADIYGPRKQDPTKPSFVGKLLQRFMPEPQRTAAEEVQIKWMINIGIPCKDYSDTELSARFEKAARVGWILSELAQPITKDVICKTIDAANKNNAYQFSSERVKAVPEIIAELSEYVSSSYRGVGVHAVIDVGATTLDVGILNIFKNIQSDEDRYSIYSSSITLHGVFELARRKKNIDSPTAFEHFLREIGGMGSEMPPDITNATAQAYPAQLKELQDMIITQLVTALYETKQGDPNNSQGWMNNGVQSFLLGGGSVCRLYSDAITEANSADRARRMGLRGYNMMTSNSGEVVPDRRLSVAYGLSRPLEAIGKIEVAGPLPQPDPPPFGNFGQNAYESED